MGLRLSDLLENWYGTKRSLYADRHAESQSCIFDQRSSLGGAMKPRRRNTHQPQLQSESRHRHTPHRMVAVAAVAALLSACGSSSDSADTTAAADSVADAPTTEAAAATSGDCALEEPLKIGYAADFNLGAIGDKPGSAAAKYIIDQANAAGGVGGKPVEFEVKQISADPADYPAAQRGVQELIDGGADIILGPPFSDYGNPLLEVTKGEVPVLFVASTETVLPDPSRGSFLVTFNDKTQGSAAAEFAAKQGFKSAVTISSNEIPYTNIPQAAFKEIFEKGGGKVEKDLAFKLGQTDFSSQVNEIKAMSPQPDAIYSSFFLPEAGVFLKQLREAGVKSVVISADGFDASLIWTLGADAEGVFFTTHTFPADSNKVQQFLDDYAKSGGEKIETAAFGALGADAAQIALQAASSACTTDGKALIEAISGLSGTFTTGDVSYAGTNGTPNRAVTILTVTDGKPVLADSFVPAVVAG
jgi:branched-chain amino acid transport system substrate-binding protein